MVYPTERWKCWDWAKKTKQKQLREDTVEIKKKKGRSILALGSLTHDRFFKYFDDLESAFIPGEPYGAEVGRNVDFSRACCEEVERRGFAGDLCSYIRNYWGSAFLNRMPWGAEFPKPDFCIQGAHCDSHNKWFQQLAEHFGCPYYVYDDPEMFHWWENPPHAIQYKYDNMMEEIEWLEKFLGQKMNDEKLCEDVARGYDEEVAESSEVFELAFSTRPATLDIKSWYSLTAPGISMGPEWAKMFHEEIRDRIRRGISAIPNYKMTMMHDGPPPWFDLQIFRYMEKWGVVCIPSHYLSAVPWRWDPEKKELVLASKYANEKKTPPPRTREEAVWQIASRPPRGGQIGAMTGDAPRDVLLAMAKNFPIDGCIFHLNKGCEGWSRGRLLAKVALERELGLPCLTYEGNHADRREWNEAQVLSRLDAFFESLGLKKEG